MPSDDDDDRPSPSTFHIRLTLAESFVWRHKEPLRNVYRLLERRPGVVSAESLEAGEQVSERAGWMLVKRPQRRTATALLIWIW